MFPRTAAITGRESCPSRTATEPTARLRRSIGHGRPRGLGKQADGTYDLKVTLPGKQPRELNAPACGNEQFKSLQWLGFVSLAAEKTVFYLDNVALSYSETGDN